MTTEVNAHWLSRAVCWLDPRRAEATCQHVQVDVNAPDPDSFPLFMRVPYSECTLNEGDILYIPRRWWHFVRAETPSISVNYWWTVPS